MLTRMVFIAGTALFATAAGAQAKPFDRSLVPASAPWIVHVDVEAALGSTFARAALHGNEPILAEIAEEMTEELGFDLLTEVRAVTVYGIGADPEDAVFIMNTTPVAEGRLIALAAASGDVAIVQNGRTMYAVGGPHHVDHYGCFVAGPGADERLLVLAEDKEALSAAAALLEKRDRVAADIDTSPIAKGPRQGSIVFVSAAELANAVDLPEVAVVLGRAEGVRVDLGEVGGEFYLDADARVAKAEEAVQMQQMIQGGLAMAQFAAGRHPEVAPLAALASGFSVAVNDRDVSVRFRHDSQKLFDAVRSFIEEDIDMDFDHDHDEHGGHDVDVQVGVKVRVDETGKIIHE